MHNPYVRFLLRLFPKAVRERHGSEIVSMYDEIRGELGPRPGFLRLARFYITATADVFRRLARRRTRRTGSRHSIRNSWGGELMRDVAYAFRMLRRAPGFAAVAIVTIALGIGANVAIFTVVNGIILRPLPYDDPDRLVMVFNQYPTLEIRRGAQSPGDLADYREQTDAVESFGSVSTFPQTMLLDGVPQLMSVALVTPGFFEMMGVQPILGRDIASDDDHDRALISYGYWQSEFGGDSSIIGTTIPFDGLSKIVIGILPPDFRLVLPSYFGIPERPDMYTNIPAHGWLGPDGRDRTAHWMKVIGRLRPGRTVAQLQAQMDAVAEWQRANIPRRGERQATIEVVPLRAEVVGNVRETLFAVSGAVGFVLLIACANVANLLLARAQHREREMSIRAAIGGSRARIVRQVLTEGIVLAGIAATLGVGLAVVGVESIVALQPDNVPRLEDSRVDGMVLGFTTIVTILAAVLFGAMPALAAGRPDLARALTTRGSGGPRGVAVKNAFIVLEVALSLILLIGSGLLFRSFVKLHAVDPGFQTERMLTFKAHPPQSVLQDSRVAGSDVHPGRERYYRELGTAISELPGVEAVGTVFPTPLGGQANGSTYTTDVNAGDEESQLASSQLVTPTYFSTVGIPILAGRTFRPGDQGDKVIVDANMAEHVWPGENPIGKQLRVGWWSGAKWAEVIGVVGSARTHELVEPNPPTLYRLAAVYEYSPQTFMVRTRGAPLDVADPIRSLLCERYSTAPMTEVRPLQEYADEQAAPMRFVMTLIGVFAGIALLLAAVGLYGVISYLVSHRTREIGIRMAFGARAGQVFGLLMRQGMGLTALGILIGVGGAVALSRLLSSFLFEVTPTDPVTYGAIAGLLVVVAALACYAPARRATRVDPVVSLKSE